MPTITNFSMQEHATYVLGLTDCQGVVIYLSSPPRPQVSMCSHWPMTSYLKLTFDKTYRSALKRKLPALYTIHICTYVVFSDIIKIILCLRNALFP